MTYENLIENLTRPIEKTGELVAENTMDDAIEAIHIYEHSEEYPVNVIMEADGVAYSALCAQEKEPCEFCGRGKPIRAAHDNT